MNTRINKKQWALAMSLLLVGAGHAISQEPIATVQPNNEFGYALTKTVARAQLAKNANQNIFLSPVSAAVALQMLLNGAGKGSTTYSEITTALGVESLDLEAINHANADLLTQLQKPTADTTPPGRRRPGPPPVPFTLKIANSVWSNSTGLFKYNSSFVSRLEKSYSADARSVDFRAAEGPLAINGWASEKTNGKIPKVIDAPTLAPLAFVMMNATYFKANWLTPFDERSTTRNSAFTLGDGAKAEVEMMNSREYGYAETENAQTMELPYAGGNASMYVVLPKEGIKLSDSLTDANGPLSSAFWVQVAKAQKMTAVFSMPKFSFSYEAKLNDYLKAMGMNTVFTNNADLSALGTPATRVSLVKQDTFIKVDEKGTEAAAVTVIGGVGSGRPVKTHIMRVDRPFLISIVEKNTGSVLFLGVISNPKSR